MLQGNVPSRGGTAQQNPQGRETEEKPGTGLDPLKEDLTHNCAMLGNHSFLCSTIMAGARSRAVNTAVAVGETAISTCLCDMPRTDTGSE